MRWGRPGGSPAARASSAGSRAARRCGRRCRWRRARRRSGSASSSCCRIRASATSRRRSSRPRPSARRPSQYAPAMSLSEVEGPAGAPWERPMHGTLDRLVVESEVLAGNPLGDPSRRPLWVYRPPGVERDHPRPLPSIYIIQGFTGQLDMWERRDAFEPTVIERFDALFASGDCPDALLVFVDAWTRYGGSQFLNSSSTGRYLDYLCDEVVAFVDARYPTAAERDHRGLAGKSSGGYGAMVVPMLRPDVFGALASHAGDALFEACYLPEFPKVARLLRDRFDGSWEVFFDRLATTDHVDFKTFRPI